MTRKPPIEDALLHLEFGDAVAQQTADAIRRSNTVTEWPARFSWSAAARPAGPDPTTATFFHVRDSGGFGLTHPSSNARSMIATSISLIVTGSSLMPSTHEPSHGAGHSAGELREVVRRVQTVDRRFATGRGKPDRSSRESGCRADTPGGRTECRSPCSARPEPASRRRQTAGTPRASRGCAPRPDASGASSA